MTRPALILAAALLLQACSNSYHVLATVIGGRLAFVPAEGRYECISIISVRAMGPRAPDPAIDAIEDPMKRAEAVERVRLAWSADGISFSCEAHYPIFYGAELPNMPVRMPPKKLRVGVPYSVGVMGPQGQGGYGCFRMTKEGRAENLADHLCNYYEPMPAAPEPSQSGPAPAIVAPAEPRADPQSLIRPEDYPESALRAGEQGRVRFALEVGADGRVSECSVTRSSGAISLDTATCRIMRSRARFTPARDSNGNPAPSRVEREVAWTLPAGTIAAAQKVTEWGNGMVSNSLPAEPVLVREADPVGREPIMAIPQDGPGKADLSVWDGRTREIRTLRRYRSIPVCRRAMAKLQLRAGQKAYCTVAPKKHRDWGIH